MVPPRKPSLYEMVFSYVRLTVMKRYQSTIGFYGGVGSVTGANFLLDTGNLAILIDCGLVQGGRPSADYNAQPFLYDPAHIDILIITHAHTDHIGRIPKLIHDGFRGVIYSTPPTKALASVMLEDAFHIMQLEHEIYDAPVWYEQADIQRALSQWQTFGYYESRSLGDELTLHFTNAGHILGSAMVYLTRHERTLVCTGDVGNVPQPLVAPPDPLKDCQYLITESVYGDRLHEGVAERSDLLRAQIEDTQARGGTLIIPAFSLERTQSMLNEINNLVESGEIEPLPVFLDSPLAITVTDIYRRYTSYMKSEVQERLETDDDLFSFPGFKATKTAAGSATIHSVTGPKIIIAGSGMSHGGRIRSHEQTYLADPNATLLLVGHQVVGSLGRRLQDGAQMVTIDGVTVLVKAKIVTIHGFSGHADRDQLLDLIYSGHEQLEQVFITMGEEKASLFLTQRVHDYIGVPVCAPSENEEVVIQL